MVATGGLEPPTPALRMLCSNQLSYVAIKYRYPVIGARILATDGVFVNSFKRL